LNLKEIFNILWFKLQNSILILKIYEEEKKTHSVNSHENQKLYYELADTKSLLQQANFKRDNYDKIKL